MSQKQPCGQRIQMALLWAATEGSRLATNTGQIPQRSHQYSGDLPADDSHSMILGRYRLEYLLDNLHKLAKVKLWKRNLQSDYQDFRIPEVQHTLHRTYINHNESEMIHSAGETVLISESADDNFEESASGIEQEVEAGDEIVTESEDMSIKHIIKAEDLKEAGQPLCRSRENYLPPELFSADSCALCYGYLQNQDIFYTKWLPMDLLKTLMEGGRAYTYKITVLFNPKNVSQLTRQEEGSSQGPGNQAEEGMRGAHREQPRIMYGAQLKMQGGIHSGDRGVSNNPRRRVHQQVLDTLHPTEEVKKLLGELDTSKAVGPDNISLWILREGADALRVPLTTIFNKSSESGTLPEAWKTANVIPVKKVDRWAALDYRPT
ncbi:uncharacterized protein [Cherax quadricarinatus]|uniref:uncharacterized protein n=1 Tax=Cherax quadricarinatus TaxID=27406 RepID=UPI00387EDC0D